MDVWHMISVERASLVDALDRLADEDWARPSLCAGWSVRQVVGHLVVTASITPVMFLGGLVANGFRRSSLTQGGVRWITHGRDNHDLVAALRARVHARTAPPGPTLSWLGETIVHGEDIFRAIGGYREHPSEHVVAVADFYRTSNRLISARRRVAGVTLRATDADWCHGTGPEATGPIIAILLAMAGRGVALDDLTGPGVGVLRERG